jgi:hypothetical protein
MILYIVTVCAFLALAGLGCNRFMLAAIRLFVARKSAAPEEWLVSSPQELPHVLVQLPIYNEPNVCVRVIRAAAALDWPPDRLHVQVLDDSTDETTSVIAAAVRALRLDGLDFHHIRRTHRQGFKAGALANGLTQDDSPFVAIFDADFVPPPDFLRRTIPTLQSQPKLAFVQARWEHLNAAENPLTAAQASMLDAHFAVEQWGRARAGLFLPFNGTCGVWSRAAIEAAGGWGSDVLCEDLDLSIRARLAGWGGAFRDDLTVPGELPTTLAGWRAQQFRWTKGFAQAARKLLLPVWRSNLPLVVKLALTVQLCEPACYPLTALSLCGSALIVLADRNEQYLPLLGLGVAVTCILGSAVFLALGRAVLHRDRWARFPANFAVTLLLVAGLMVSNARAVVEALIGRTSGFTRTPKRGESGPTRLREARGATGLSELAFGSVFALALVHAAGWLSPLFSLSTLGLLVVGTGLARERWISPAMREPIPATVPGDVVTSRRQTGSDLRHPRGHHIGRTAATRGTAPGHRRRGSSWHPADRG